jgi:hypothetical protein
MLISSEKYKKMKKKVHEQYCNVLFLDKQPQDHISSTCTPIASEVVPLPSTAVVYHFNPSLSCKILVLWAE